MRWISRLVTFVLVVAIVGALALLVRGAMPKQNVGQDFRTYALLRDGSRLAVGSPVVIAGVRVGEVSKLTVENGFARADLVLRNATRVPRNSWITKRAESAFGDSYLEIIPPDDEGAEVAEPLGNDEPLSRVIEGGSTDSALRAAGRAVPRFDNALDGVYAFVTNGRRWVDDSMTEGAERAGAFIGDGRIAAGMSAADRAATRLDEGTARAQTALAGAGPDFLRRLDGADRAIASTRAKMADVKSGLHDGLERVQHGLDGLDQPIADYHEVVAAIASGSGDDWRGTLGRLVNNHELGDQIDDVTEDARVAADGLFHFKSWLGMRFEYNVFSRIPRVYASAEIRAHNDKFYLLEFERDSLGSLPDTQLSDAAGTPTSTRTIEIHDKLRFTAQLGKQLGWLALRGGVKDSTFGVGADALINNGRLRLSFDAFGGFERAPRIKVAAALAVFRSIYVVAGIDDAFSTPGYLHIEKDSQDVPDDLRTLRYGRDYFLGATLHFDDADLATLLRVYGALLVSAL